MLSGIGGTIAQGMAFGTGSAIAHQAIGGITGMFGGGSRGDPVEQAAPQQQQMQPQQSMSPQMGNTQNDSCAYDQQAFYTCLSDNKNDQSTCNFLYEQLKQCQQNQAQFS